MIWATRTGVHIDRAACAWLIRRFIDPEARFVFVDDPADVPAEATPFDIRGVELSHHGQDCTFETILKRYDLADRVLWDIARIVHEAHLDDERYDAPEAPASMCCFAGSRWSAAMRRCSRSPARCSTGSTSPKPGDVARTGALVTERRTP